MKTLIESSTTKLAKDGEQYVLYRHGEELSRYDSLLELVGDFIIAADFTANLLKNDTVLKLAEAAQQYPEYRIGQLIINAMKELTPEYQCPEVFYMTDGKLQQGLEKLYQRKLISHDTIKATLHEGK